MLCNLLVSGLLIFCAVAKLRNSGKSAKSCEIHKNTQDTCEIRQKSYQIRLYSNFETCLSYWGYLLAVNPQIYVKTSSLKCANNVPKLPGVDYVVKNWALVMMLKALPLVHFRSILLLKEQMMTSVRKTLKTLVWSAQNQSIPREMCPNITTKSTVFYRLLSGQVCPKNSHKISSFFRDFVPKNPAKFDFFFHDLSEALLC